MKNVLKHSEFSKKKEEPESVMIVSHASQKHDECQHVNSSDTGVRVAHLVVRTAQMKSRFHLVKQIK